MYYEQTMTVASQESTHAVQELPSELESARSKLIYLSLRTGGERTVDELQRETGLQKLTVLSILRTLENRGLVDESDARFRALER